MPFTIVRQDISKMKVDAIVNAANTDLKMGGGVCGAIFKKAGAEELQAACDKLAPIKTGEAVITPAFALPSKYIIHTAGPVYKDWDKDQSDQLLRLAYTNSLKLALDNKCESIAFPLISSGIYGYPKDKALMVARKVIKDFLKAHDLDVTLVIFDKSAFSISRQLVGAVESYIDEHYVDVRIMERVELLDVEREALSKATEQDTLADEFLKDEVSPMTVLEPLPLDDLASYLDEPFSRMLLSLIDAKGMTDVEVYKRANIDRRLFSRIRTNESYRPSKQTAIALAVALRLSLEETEDFLKRAGYALSNALIFDVIIKYFIAHRKFDIFEINEVLFDFDQQLLGGH
ncbi:MAG TPA: macro domain-containing protein [Bacillota bacterium]|nr:macro domain-containing protein [Bacillota bacterium]